VSAQRAGVLDDAIRGVGIKPHPEPDPGDVRRLANAAKDERELRATITAAGTTSDLDDDERLFLETAHAIAREQGQAVSSGAATRSIPSGTASVTDVVELAAAMADDRAADAVDAVSPAVAQVLASMAAGLDQVVVAGKHR
jgi:hypothetical protein